MAKRVAKEISIGGENYDSSIIPVRSDISRFSRGTERILDNIRSKRWSLWVISGQNSTAQSQSASTCQYGSKISSRFSVEIDKPPIFRLPWPKTRGTRTVQPKPVP